MTTRSLKGAMMTSALALGLSIAISALPAAAQSDLKTINSYAMELAGQKKFDEALAVLGSADASVKSGYDHRFLKARILSWDGQYGLAKMELDSLAAEFPGNPDVQLAQANLAFYQGKLGEAEALYSGVLAGYPDYADARTGLNNVRKARAERGANRRDWRIDGAAGISGFDQDNIADWDDQFLRVEYAPGDLAYFASAQRYNRFDQTNIEIRAGISDAVRGGWDWGLDAGITPSADFRPDFSLGARIGRAIETAGGATLYPELSYRYDDYELSNIHNVQPGLTAYLDDGLILSGRLIATLQSTEPDQLGWLVEGRKSLSDRVQIRAGYANAPEAINGLAIDTKSVFGGLTYTVSDDLDLHLNLARDDRENSFVRTSGNVGFTYKR